MADRERGALIVAAVGGLVWGTLMAIVAWRFDGAEIVLLQGFIFGAAYGCGVLAGRPATGALAGVIFVGTAIWTYEVLPGWGFEHSVPAFLPAVDRETIIEQFDAADIVLGTTHIVGALCGLGGGSWATLSAAPPETATANPEPKPPPLPPLSQPAATPSLWSDGDAPETPSVAERPPEMGHERRSAPVAVGPDPNSRRRIAAGALAVMALGADAALGLLFFEYSEAQETGAFLFAALAAAAAAFVGRRYALAALAAGVILASAAGAIQDAEYGDRHTEITVIR